MGDKAAIEDLIAQLEAGWPDGIDTPDIPPTRAVFGDGHQSSRVWNALDGDKNDATALVAHVLPGWHWLMHSGGAEVFGLGVEGDTESFTHDGEPARSLVICTLRAMIWELDNA